MSLIPHHLSEKLFRFYEPAITTIITYYPKAAVFNPSIYMPGQPRSCETFKARLRDAMRSYRDYGWPSSSIDRTAFLSHHDNIVVAQKRDLIYAGPLDSINEAVGSVNINPLPVASSKDPVPFAHELDLSSFHTLCRLAADRLLTAPLILSIPISWVNPALSSFDILLTPHDNKHILS